MHAIAIQGSMVGRQEKNGPQGSGLDLDVMFTLNTTDKHAVAILQEEQFVDDAERQLSMFSSEEHPAKVSVSQDSERDWMTRVATSCSRILRLLQNIGPSGWFGRTYPACYPVMEETILPPSFEGWKNSGMGSPTEFLTLNISEFPNDAVVCSLSDVLEVGSVPRRYFLSGRACRGILRRADKRGKLLPRSLHEALQAVASEQTSIATED